MKLIMTLLVRDEQDIIRENIEFHLSQGVDYIIATDNRSVDSTADILKEYRDQGLLEYIHEPNDDYNQHAWVTRMARMAFTEFGADWVINSDADEFWWPLSGTLKSTFESISSDYNILRADRTNFIPPGNTAYPFYEQMIYAEKYSLNSLGQPLPAKVAHRGCKKVVVEQGNHKVNGVADPKAADGLIEILHFPHRSYEQLLNKIAKGGAAYRNNKELPENVGDTWRALYKEYLRYGDLRNYYRRILLNEAQIRLSLQSGLLEQDTRLRSYFINEMPEMCRRNELEACMENSPVSNYF